MSFYSDASLVMIPSGYKASKVYSAVPTDGLGDLDFTRSLDTASRVGPDGLIEKVRTNLILQSQTLDNATWDKTGAAGITANATTAPDGTITADRFNFNGGGVQNARVAQTLLSTSAGLNLQASFRAKADIGDNKISVLYNNGLVFSSITYDLDAGTSTFVSGALTITHNIQLDINGFFLCSASFPSAAATPSISIRNTNASAVGDGVFLWGFQVEVSDFGPTPYIETTTAAVSVGMLANVPRLDYLGRGCPKLLLEPQRQNLMTFSEQFNNDDWEKTGTTISANVATSPDGFTDADKIVGDASAGDKLASQLKFITVAQAFTISSFFKKSEYKLAFVRAGGQTGSPYVIYNLDTEAVVQTSGASSTKIEDYGNGWYRVSLTLNSATTGTCAPNIIFLPDSGFTLTGLNVPQYTGDGTSGGFVWGCQLEANGGSFATSYIPTLAAAVTRSADAASKTGISALIGQTEGTIFVEVDLNAVLTRSMFTIDVGNTTNFISLLSNSANQIRCQVRLNGTSTNVITSAAVSTGTHKVAFAYKSGDYSLFVDGIELGNSSSTTLPTGTLQRYVLNNAQYGELSDGYSQALLFKTRLTNAQLAELTA